jgi:hypothetical protein
MRAAAIFFAFFIIFTSALIVVPIPLFPGNLVIMIIEPPLLDYIVYMEAITNGMTYGLAIWLVFLFIDKKLEKSVSTTSQKIT